MTDERKAMQDRLEAEKKLLCDEKKQLQEQYGFLRKVIRIVRRIECTPSEEIMRENLMREFELRGMPLVDTINDLNTEIYKLQQMIKEGEAQA